MQQQQQMAMTQQAGQLAQVEQRREQMAGEMVQEAAQQPPQI
jgi:hypothetical protein